MKQKKDISDLIRDNQHKLSERPPARTWKRLESRLDNQRNKNNTFLYRQLAMAAAVVALVAVISLLAVVTNQKNTNYAQADIASENWRTQDLEQISTDANSNTRQVVEFQRKLKDRYSNPIAEGTASKKLIVSKRINSNNFNQKPQLDQSSVASNHPTSPAPIEHMAFDDAPSAGLEMEDTEEITEEITTVTMDESPQPIAPSKTAATPKDNIAMSSKKENKVSKKRKIIFEIQELEWLAGTWKNNNTLTEWKKFNTQIIASENYSLEKYDNDLFFVKIKSDERYLFQKQNNSSTFFKNKNNEQVVLEKINDKRFSITFLKNNKTLEVIFFDAK